MKDLEKLVDEILLKETLSSFHDRKEEEDTDDIYKVGSLYLLPNDYRQFVLAILRMNSRDVFIKQSPYSESIYLKYGYVNVLRISTHTMTLSRRSNYYGMSYEEKKEYIDRWKKEYDEQMIEYKKKREEWERKVASGEIKCELKWRRYAGSQEWVYDTPPPNRPKPPPEYPEVLKDLDFEDERFSSQFDEPGKTDWSRRTMYGMLYNRPWTIAVPNETESFEALRELAEMRKDLFGELYDKLMAAFKEMEGYPNRNPAYIIIDENRGVMKAADENDAINRQKNESNMTAAARWKPRPRAAGDGAAARAAARAVVRAMVRARSAGEL